VLGAPSYNYSKNYMADVHDAKSSVVGINDHVKALKSMYPAHSRVAIVGCGKW
jgi:hypothetical protein